MEGLPGLSDAKNAVGGSKNIPLTAERIIAICKAVSRKSAETVSFFYSVSPVEKTSDFSARHLSQSNSIDDLKKAWKMDQIWHVQ